MRTPVRVAFHCLLMSCVPVAQAPPPERKTARRKGEITKPKNGKASKEKEERD